MRTKHALLVAAMVSVSTLASTGTAVADAADGLSRARAGTAGYHNVKAAVADGYQLFTDAAGVACIDKPGVGGMGIHYVKGALVGNPAEDVAHPEALVYEPEENGRLRLVAVEYIVLRSAWKEAGHAAPPSRFGQQFKLIPAGNRYGLPPFYELHAWIWKHNPRGVFNDWNPRVSCAAA